MSGIMVEVGWQDVAERLDKERLEHVARILELEAERDVAVAMADHLKAKLDQKVVWADDATPFCGSQVKDLLDENESLRAVAEAARMADCVGNTGNKMREALAELDRVRSDIGEACYARGREDGIREVIEQFEHLYVESFPEDWRWRDVIDVLKQKMSS